QQRGRFPPCGGSTPVTRGPATTKGQSATLTEGPSSLPLTRRAASDPDGQRSGRPAIRARPGNKPAGSDLGVTVRNNFRAPRGPTNVLAKKRAPRGACATSALTRTQARSPWRWSEVAGPVRLTIAPLAPRSSLG